MKAVLKIHLLELFGNHSDLQRVYITSDEEDVFLNENEAVNHAKGDKTFVYEIERDAFLAEGNAEGEIIDLDKKEEHTPISPLVEGTVKKSGSKKAK